MMAIRWRLPVRRQRRHEVVRQRGLLIRCVGVGRGRRGGRAARGLRRRAGREVPVRVVTFHMFDYIIILNYLLLSK